MNADHLSPRPERRTRASSDPCTQVHAFTANTHSPARCSTPQSSQEPVIPSPRRPIDSVPMQVLGFVLAGLQRLAVAT